MQLEVYNCSFCYFIVFFHKDNLIKIWKIPRSTEYWNWMLPKLLYFLDCVNTCQPPSDIPLIYHEVNTIVQRKCTFESLGTNRIKARDLPPNNTSILLNTFKITTDQLTHKHKDLNLYVSKIVLLFFFLAFLFSILHLIPTK